MNDRATIENIIRRRMHGLYLSRRCDNLETLAHKLLGMHSWFCRNVPFSALIRGADMRGWKTRLTKTWLYRGTLHGVVYEDLSLWTDKSRECGILRRMSRLSSFSRRSRNI